MLVLSATTDRTRWRRVSDDVGGRDETGMSTMLVSSTLISINDVGGSMGLGHSSRLDRTGRWGMGRVERETGRVWDESGKTRMGRVERDEGVTLVSATDVRPVKLETSTMLVLTSYTVGLARDRSSPLSDRQVDTAVPVHLAGLARTRGPRGSCRPVPGQVWCLQMQVR